MENQGKQRVCGDLANCVCGNCGSQNWSLQFGNYKDGRKTLIISCANPECLEQQRSELHGLATDAVIWAEYDISNQSGDISHDASDVGSVEYEELIN